MPFGKMSHVRPVPFFPRLEAIRAIVALTVGRSLSVDASRRCVHGAADAWHLIDREGSATAEVVAAHGDRSTTARVRSDDVGPASPTAAYGIEQPDDEVKLFVTPVT